MKKILCFVLILASIVPLAASDLFESPSLLAGNTSDNPFTVRFDAEAGVDGIKFLSDPLSLDSYSDAAVKSLLDRNISFWKENPQVVSAFTEFDATFPSFTGNDELDKAMIDSYLKNTFLSSGYGRERRSFVLSSLAGEGVLSSITGPASPSFSLSMNGDHFKNGFGWKWFFSAGFDGTSSLFSDVNGELVIKGGASFAYSSFFSERLSFGISLTPEVLMRNTVLNSNMLKGRLTADFISLFSEDFLFGIKVSVNTGLTYRLTDEFSLTLDLRNFPASSHYVRWKLTDIASLDPKFTVMGGYRTGSPDLVATGRWSDGVNTVKVSASSLLDLGSADLWSIFDLSYERTLGKAMAFGVTLSDGNLGLTFSSGGFKAGLSTGLDRLRFGTFFSFSV
ncbi:MAG: hypothetical protein ACI4NM_03475 [Bullifex sp.]